MYSEWISLQLHMYWGRSRWERCGTAPPLCISGICPTPFVLLTLTCTVTCYIRKGSPPVHVGLETFSQLVTFENGQYYLPQCSISDQPRFKYRGFLVDTSRHYQPLKYLYQFLVSKCGAVGGVWQESDFSSVYIPHFQVVSLPSLYYYSCHILSYPTTSYLLPSPPLRTLWHSTSSMYFTGTLWMESPSPMSAPPTQSSAPRGPTLRSTSTARKTSRMWSRMPRRGVLGSYLSLTLLWVGGWMGEGCVVEV